MVHLKFDKVKTRMEEEWETQTLKDIKKPTKKQLQKVANQWVRYLTVGHSEWEYWDKDLNPYTVPLQIAEWIKEFFNLELDFLELLDWSKMKNTWQLMPKDKQQIVLEKGYWSKGKGNFESSI